MTKFEFLGDLSRLISDLPADDRDQAMEYYEDKFADAGFENEENLINDFVSPEYLAGKIREISEQKQNGQIPRDTDIGLASDFANDEASAGIEAGFFDTSPTSVNIYEQETKNSKSEQPQVKKQTAGMGTIRHSVPKNESLQKRPVQGMNVQRQAQAGNVNRQSTQGMNAQRQAQAGNVNRQPAGGMNAQRQAQAGNVNRQSIQGMNAQRQAQAGNVSRQPAQGMNAQRQAQAGNVNRQPAGGMNTQRQAQAGNVNRQSTQGMNVQRQAQAGNVSRQGIPGQQQSGNTRQQTGTGVHSRQLTPQQLAQMRAAQAAKAKQNAGMNKNLGRADSQSAQVQRLRKARPSGGIHIDESELGDLTTEDLNGKIVNPWEAKSGNSKKEKSEQQKKEEEREKLRKETENSSFLRSNNRNRDDSETPENNEQQIDPEKARKVKAIVIVSSPLWVIASVIVLCGVAAVGALAVICVLLALGCLGGVIFSFVAFLISAGNGRAGSVLFFLGLAILLVPAGAGLVQCAYLLAVNVFTGAVNSIRAFYTTTRHRLEAKTMQ